MGQRRRGASLRVSVWKTYKRVSEAGSLQVWMATSVSVSDTRSQAPRGLPGQKLNAPQAFACSGV